MGKLLVYVTVMRGIMLLFYFGGLLGEDYSEDGTCGGVSPNSVLLNQLLRPECDTGLRNKIMLAVEGVLAIAAIAIGFVTRDFEKVVMTPVAIYIFNLFWDFLIVFSIMRDTNPVLAILFFSPFIIYLPIAILDWWRGRD